MVGVPGDETLVGIHRLVAQRIVVEVADDDGPGLIGDGPDQVVVELDLAEDRPDAVRPDGRDKICHRPGAGILPRSLDDGVDDAKPVGGRVVRERLVERDDVAVRLRDGRGRSRTAGSANRASNFAPGISLGIGGSPRRA
jgi:hypothetical protein